LNVRLRPAAPCDAALLAVINGEASAYPWSEAQIADACAVDASPGEGTQCECVLVVEQNEDTCGFIIYTQLLDEGAIHNIAVSPAYQRRGMARTLLAEVLKVFARDGAIRALLEVRASNTAAQSLYSSFGFELDAVRKNYYPSKGTREDALLMSKPLITGE
jgi:ribosomal-protein-alanine N-acetyltransferase